MHVIHIDSLHFYYEGTAEDVFLDINCSLYSDDKIGLIGKNGSGKSTLFQLMYGTLLPVEGNITRRNSCRIGYLPQSILLNEDDTVRDFLWQARPELAVLKQKIDRYCTDPSSESVTIFSDFEDRGGYNFEYQFDKVMGEFLFDESFINRHIQELSGGEKTRIALCQLILTEPDVLLLDEPTNHLDLDALKWLEEYLSNLHLPFIIISHDRSFLDACVSTIWEIEDKGVRIYSGNYTAYKIEKEAEFRRSMELYERQQKKIRQLEQTYRARKSWALTMQKETGAEGYAPVYEELMNNSRKAMKRAKNIESRIERMLERERADKPYIEKKRKLIIENSAVPNRFVLYVNDVSFQFQRRDDERNEIFEGLSFVVENGIRLAITGPNGSGKTTLLKLLTGMLQPSDGDLRWAPQVRLSYFAQEFENLNLEQTIIEEVIGGDRTKQTKARTILGSLALSDDKVYQKIGTLSLGERSKVSLTKVILSEASVLLLDEPTNHLEIHAREAIEDALRDYPGTILFVTHDRYLVANLATHTMDLQQREITVEEYKNT